MAQKWLIIDGYNLLHAAGLMRPRMGPDGLRRARRKLVGRLERALNEPTLRNTTIVFDGQGAETAVVDGGADQIETMLQIQFSAAASDADTKIEQLLAHHSSPAQVLVVSSDHRLHKAASRRKAKCVDSEEFLDSLDETPEENGGVGQHRGNMGTGWPEKPDVAERQSLEAEFLEIDPQELEAEEWGRARRRQGSGLHKKRRL